MNGLPFFPYPHVFRGVRGNGLLRQWPITCERCDQRPCEKSTLQGEVGVCAYGLNYLRVDADLLIAGIVLTHYGFPSPAWKRQRNTLPVVDPNDLVRSIQGYRATQQAQQFTVEYLDALKPEILKGLSFFHDYRQINTQIIQNINAHLEEQYPHLPLEKQLEKASHSERAIYESARFLEEKLNVARFLIDPEWLLVTDACSRFRVHGLVVKYVKIYQSRCEARAVRLRVSGDSYSTTLANGTACGVIPHTMIDNAVKYAPDDSTVEILVKDVANGVQVEVSSYGPFISPDEEIAIFSPFVRGAAAKRVAEEGAGYGLYVSQLVARQHLGTAITVRQDRDRKRAARWFWTTFSVLFPHKAAILE